MVTVEFYFYTDDVSGLEKIGDNIIDRFKQGYPDATSDINYNRDKGVFGIKLNVDGNHIEYVDTFLCEEICHEYECYVTVSDFDNRMSYYFDEEDEWFIKN